MLQFIRGNFQAMARCLKEENSLPYRRTNFISSHGKPTSKISLMLDISGVIRNIFGRSETLVP